MVVVVLVVLDSCERLGSSRIKVRRGYHPQEVTKIDNPSFQRSALRDKGIKEYANYYYYYYLKKEKGGGEHLRIPNHSRHTVGSREKPLP